MILIYINIGVIVLGVIGYIIWNLLRKVEKLENTINVQEKYILDFYDSEAIMSASSNSVIEANFLGLTTSLSFVYLFMIYVPSKEETFSALLWKWCSMDAKASASFCK